MAQIEKEGDLFHIGPRLGLQPPDGAFTACFFKKKIQPSSGIEPLRCSVLAHHQILEATFLQASGPLDM